MKKIKGTQNQNETSTPAQVSAERLEGVSGGLSVTATSLDSQRLDALRLIGFRPIMCW